MDEIVDRLYALPLEEFTRERDAAAREVRKAGDRAAAAIIAKLPKPTPAAWAANQVAREHPDVLSALLDAGAALRSAQEATIAGERADLREATRAQRQAVDDFMATAQTLTPAGRPLSRAMSDRLRTTLLAAAGNEPLADALASARLALEAEAGGAWPPPSADEESAAAGARKPADAGARATPKRPKSAASAREKTAASGGRAAAGGESTAREGAAGRGGSGESRDRAAGAAARSTRRAAAERSRREADAERERREAERQRREAEREARRELERQLGDLRVTIRARQRALATAEKDAARAARRLEEALAAAEEARAEAEAMDRLVAEARAALGAARDDAARLEERLD